MRLSRALLRSGTLLTSGKWAGSGLSGSGCLRVESRQSASSNLLDLMAAKGKPSNSGQEERPLIFTGDNVLMSLYFSGARH